MSAPPLGPSPAQITFMGHNIAARIAALRARRRRRTRLAIVGSVVAVGVALTAAGIAVATAPADVRATTFTCFTADDPGSTSVSMSLLDEQVGLEGDELVAAVLESCDIAFGMSGVTTPAPTACELADGRLGVFPNLPRLDPVAFCTSLGLGRPTG